MSRREFTKATKREALRRAKDLCEAVGEWYGYPPGIRCNLSLSWGVEFDHVILDANRATGHRHPALKDGT